ncbi:MAG: hypothetical protein FWC91_14745 [Defluviitaleaceae bacterium]|nr:hypothetical protein [Defluviitaleaceae bacterium]
MNKITVVVFFSLFLLIVLSGCNNPTASEQTYLVRSGGQRASTGFFQTGVFVSPAGSLVPHLVEDGRETRNISGVESLLSQLSFNQGWIQAVRNNLNRSGSAFVFYTNIHGYYRWLWITEN